MVRADTEGSVFLEHKFFPVCSPLFPRFSLDGPRGKRCITGGASIRAKKIKVEGCGRVANLYRRDLLLPLLEATLVFYSRRSGPEIPVDFAFEGELQERQERRANLFSVGGDGI